MGRSARRWGAEGASGLRPCFCTIVLVTLLGAAQPYPLLNAWKDRTIMHVLTDRFGTINGEAENGRCDDFNRYCGGTWQGLKKMLPYIQDLGFDTVWISPLTEQTKGQTWQYAYGYHGYWPKNIDNVNLNYGTESDLIDLVDTAHARGMWIILDIVPNHMGFGKWSGLSPFNDESFFHDCGICDPVGCGPTEQTSANVEHCRLQQLPDLNQDVPFVSTELINWVKRTYTKFNLDGLRVDAAGILSTSWMQDLTRNTSIYTVGEFFERSVQTVTTRINTKQLQSSLNFPFYYSLLAVFQTRRPIWNPDVVYELPSSLHKLYLDITGLLDDPTKILLMPIFIENHDVPRFLCWNPDVQMYKNALAVTAFFPGMTTLYNGGEQGFRGQRDASWNWGYNRNSETYVFISRLMKYRRLYNVSTASYEPVTYSMDSQTSPWGVSINFLGTGNRNDYKLYHPDYYATPGRFLQLAAFTRGDVLVLFNNLQEDDLQFDDAAAQAAATAAASFGPAWSNTPTTPIIRLNGPRFGAPTNADWSCDALIDSWGSKNCVLKPSYYTWNDTSTYRNVTLTNILDPKDQLLVVNGVTQYTISRDRGPKVYVVTARSFGDPVPPGIVIAPLPAYDPFTLFHAKGYSTFVVTICFYALTGTLGLFLALTMASASPPWLRRLLEHTPAPVQKAKAKVDSPQVTVDAAAVPAAGGPQSRNRPLNSAAGSTSQGKAAHNGSPFAAAAGDDGGNDASSLPALEVEAVDGQVPRGPMRELQLWISKKATAETQLGQQPVYTPQGVALKPSNGITGSRFGSLPRNINFVHTEAAADPEPLPRSYPSSAQIFEQCGNKSMAAQFRRRSAVVLHPRASLPEDAVLDAEHVDLHPATPTVGKVSNVTATVSEHEAAASDRNNNSFVGAKPAAGNSTLQSLRSMLHQRPSATKSGRPDDEHAHEETALPATAVMHVAMEYTIPHLAMNTQFAFGGLGKVVGIFLSCSPPEDQVLLCAPLYADAYADPDAQQPSFFEGTAPDFSFVVVVDSVMVPVELFLVSGGPNVTYIFLQADIFRRRKQGTIYKFESELEMLTWLAVTNQAVAVVISLFQISRVQFHDYHGSLSLIYLPPAIRPMVLYLAHNAHYNGRFPMATDVRKSYIFRVLDLPLEVERIVTSKGYFDIIHAVVCYLRQYQDGYGVVAVSPRYAEQIHKKFDIFRQLAGHKIKGIMNALPMSESLAELVDRAGPEDRKRVLQEVRSIKEVAKAKFQGKYGKFLTTDPNLQLVVFLGRMTHQKGCDIIALAANHMLQHCPNSQLVMVGPIGDEVGRQAQATLDSIKDKYPGRIYAPGGVYFEKEDKALLLQAADFCLMPSRFEPCGLVDIEFGWNGSLIIGHDTGGLGKMPGVFFQVQSSSQQHLTAKLERAMAQALRLEPEAKQRMVEEALTTAFPTDVMIQEYHKVWDTLAQHTHSLEHGTDEQHDAFYEDLWKDRNIKDRAAEDKSRIKYLTLPYMMGLTISRQTLSDLLMLVLQIWTQLPGALAMGFTLYLEIGESAVSFCYPIWDSGLSPEGKSSYLPQMWNMFLPRVLTYFVTATGMTPICGFIIMAIRPARYIWASVFFNVLAMSLVLSSVYWTEALFPAIIAAGISSATGPMLMSVAFLGEELEVSEVGLPFMTFTESGLAFVIFMSFIMASFVENHLVFAVICGFGFLGSMFVFVWFLFPESLSGAYFHMELDFGGQWKIMGRIKSFWISMAVTVCDSVANLLVTYLALLQLPTLRSYAYLMSICFGVRCMALVATYYLLHFKFFQLRIQTWILSLASLVGMFLAQAVAIAWGSTTVAYVIMGVTSALCAPRGNLVGLAALQVVPTRELMATWMMFVATIGFGVAMAILLTVVSDGAYVPEKESLVLGVGIAEGVRALLMVLMNMYQPGENLATL